MATTLTSMWWLVPSIVFVACVALVHGHGRTRTAAYISLGVALLLSIAILSVDTRPADSAAALGAVTAFVAFIGIYHHELFHGSQEWVRKHAAAVVGVIAVVGVVLFLPQLMPQLFCLGIAIYGIKVILFGKKH